MSASGRIVFRAFSTLHNFEGRVDVPAFTLKLWPDVGGSARWSAEADVAVSSMNTGNGARDRAMYKMFEADAYPVIHGKVTDASVPPGGSGPVTMALRIRGQEAPIRVNIDGWTANAQGLAFHASAVVSLAQFGLKPPSVAGVIRVKDTVALEGEFTAKSARSAGKTAR